MTRPRNVAELREILERAATKVAEIQSAIQRLERDEPKDLSKTAIAIWREKEQLWTEHFSTFRHGNEAMATFLGGKLARRRFPLIALSNLPTRRLEFSQGYAFENYFGPRVGKLPLTPRLLDHYAAFNRNRRPFGFVTQPYGLKSHCCIVDCGIRAQRLAVPSWWSVPAQVFVVMREDSAEEWAALEPLFMQGVTS